MGEKLSDKEERIGAEIVDAAFQIHSELGPGLLESVYERCMGYEIASRGLVAQQQVVVPIRYRGLEFDEGFRADLVIDQLVIVELKAVTEMHAVYRAQLLTYMKLMGIHLGYLINFNVRVIKNGIERLILT